MQKFISVPFKIDGSQSKGFKKFEGMAKISFAGIVFEFEATILGFMKTGVKEVRVALKEIEEIRVSRKYFRTTLEIWLNNFRTLSEIPTKHGRIVLQIAKEDRPRAEQAVKVLSDAIAEENAREILRTPVSQLFEDDETKDLEE